MSAAGITLKPGSGGYTYGWRRLWTVTHALAVNEFKVRYFGSVLGYLWSLMRPLLLFGVMYLVFTKLVRFGDNIEHYPLKLLLAIVLWSYFAEATGQSLASLVNREGLLRKIYFPPIVIPLSVALTGAFNLGLNLLVVMVFVLITGIAPTAAWLELIPLLGLLLTLTVAVSVLLSVLYVPFRDIAPIWEVTTQILWWGTPILYVFETVSANTSETVQKLLLANPLAVLIEQARHAIIDPSAPTAADAAGGAAWLLPALGVTCALCALTALLYRRSKATLAERL